MKQFMTFFLCICICVVFSACGGKNAELVVSSQNSTSPSDFQNSNPSETFERYDGITVTMATYRDYPFSQPLIGFTNAEKNHGIKFNYQMHSFETIISEVKASIAAGTQADILDTYGINFVDSLLCLQPLSSSGLDLEKNFLDHQILKASAVNGESYLVNGYGNVLKYVDLCVYNKTLFEKAGIPTPSEFCNRNEWTLEKFKWCAEKISDLGEKYIGAGVLDTSPYAIARSSFFELKNGKFIANTDKNLIKTLGAFKDMKQKGVIELSRNEFTNGYQGMALTNNKAIVWGVDSFQNGAVTSEEIGVTYLPVVNSEDVPGFSAELSGWGIIKGAKNPEAAVVFLKSFLQPGKEATKTLEYYFINKACENFYFTSLSNGSVALDYYINPYKITNKTLESDFLHKWNDDTVKNIYAYYKDAQVDVQKVCDDANELLK